ncbi:MAG: YegS/Rv2252/BmrU family lipid kinase [Armatimonadetes bacterium]|nr:YegS/Rv2252/BmrU family lipid kinase [Armatimonadota bacterium]
MADGARTVSAILNVRSRRGAEWAKTAKAALEQHGVTVHDWNVFRKTDKMVARARELVAAQTPIVLVGGGDGTLGAVANVFASTSTVMAVLPAGTGNAFAKDLGIKADLEEAAKTVATGREAHVDIGQVNGRPFVNVVTVGLTTQIAEGLDPLAKKLLGKGAYALAVLRALRDVRPFQVTVDADGKRVHMTTMQVVVGTGRFHGGPFVLSPDASLVSGELTGYAVRASKKSELLRYALLVTKGLHVALPEVESFDAEKIRIETTPPMSVTVDGETCLKTPVDCAVLPRALRVLVPEDQELSPVD